MRYFVTAPGGEKGPYEDHHIREWLRAGTMPRDALVRAEEDATGQPAHVVFPDDVAAAPPPAAAPFGPPTGGVTPFGASPNFYAPPVAFDGANEWIGNNPGNLGLGFVFGFFCGCIALIVSYVSKDMGSETKRGVRIGFVTGAVIGIAIRLIAAASR